MKIIKQTMNHEPCSKLWTWYTVAHDIPLNIAGTSEPRFLNKQKKDRNISGHRWSTYGRIIYLTMKIMCPPGGVVFMVTYLLYLSCFGRVWSFCVLLISYDQLYYAPCFASWTLLVHWHQQCVTVYHVSKWMMHELELWIATKLFWW